MIETRTQILFKWYINSTTQKYFTPSRLANDYRKDKGSIKSDTLHNLGRSQGFVKYLHEIESSYSLSLTQDRDATEHRLRHPNQKRRVQLHPHPILNSILLLLVSWKNHLPPNRLEIPRSVITLISSLEGGGGARNTVDAEGGTRKPLDPASGPSYSYLRVETDAEFAPIRVTTVPVDYTTHVYRVRVVSVGVRVRRKMRPPEQPRAGVLWDSSTELNAIVKIHVYIPQLNERSLWLVKKRGNPNKKGKQRKYIRLNEALVFKLFSFPFFFCPLESFRSLPIVHDISFSSPFLPPPRFVFSPTSCPLA